MSALFEQEALAIPYQCRHSRFLGAVALWTQAETIVEVGSHIGATAVWLARSLQIQGRGMLYCIDPFVWVNETQEAQWNANIDACGVREYVTLIKGRSQEVTWPEQVDFAFIDGNHTYPVCRHDCEKARSLGASVIAIHDTVSWEGSRRYAEVLRYEATCPKEERGSLDWSGWDMLEAEFQEGILIMKKRMPKGACTGHDIGEQWDKLTVKVEANDRP